MPGAHVQRRGIASYWRLARFNNTVLPGLAMVAGFYFFAPRNASVAPLIAAIVAYALLHAVITVWNDAADDHVDKLNGTPRAQSAKDAGSWRAVVLYCGASLVLAALCCFWLPTSSIILLGLTLLIGWLYNVRPYQASRRPVASQVCLALAYGLAPIAIGLSLSWLGGIPWVAILLVLSLTIGRSSLSLLKDYKDAAGDAQAGKKTFLLVFGGTLTARVSIVLAMAGYLGAALAVGFQSGALILPAVLSLLTVASWLLMQRLQLFRHQSYDGLNRVFHHCLKYDATFVGLVALWSYMS